MSRIYISSSWKNGIQPVLVKELRERGHKVYDFRHPGGRNDKNVWEGVSARLSLIKSYKQGMLTSSDFMRFLADQNARDRFDEHFKALSDADTCILLLPAERSSHVEAGYMAGAGKRVLVYDVSQYVKPELMYLIFDGYFHDAQSLYDALEEPVPGVCRVCGCTDTNPCHHPLHGYCSWVKPSLCSHCASVLQGGFGIRDNSATVHCVNDIGTAFK